MQFVEGIQFHYFFKQMITHSGSKRIFNWELEVKLSRPQPQ